MIKTLGIRISIRSRPQDVYNVLVDYDNYANWNPWLRVTEKQTNQYTILSVTPRSGFFRLPVNYEIKRNSQSGLIHRRQLGWLGCLATSERERVVYAKSDGTTIYATKFRIRGPLASLAYRLFGKQVARGIKDEALALKKYCETHCGTVSLPSGAGLAPGEPELEYDFSELDQDGEQYHSTL